MPDIETAKRKRLPTGERQDHLVEIAEKLCAERGPDGLKLREIARQAGLSAPAVYNHFSSLDDLLAAVALKHLTCLNDIYDNVAALSPSKAIETVCRQHVHQSAQRPGAARLFLSDLQSPSGHKSVHLLEKQVLSIRSREAELIEKGIASGEFRPVDPGNATTARMGMSLTMLAMHWLYGNAMDMPDPDRIADTVADFVLRYLASDDRIIEEYPYPRDVR